MAQIKVYTKSGTRLGSTSKAYDTTIHEELMREFTLDFSVTNTDAIFKLILPDTIFECQGEKFDITDIADDEENKETKVSAEHVSYRLNDYNVPANYAYIGTAREIGEDILKISGASAEFEITGVSVHPGEAKDIMVNAGLIACEIAMKLPKRETPAHTEDREGFFHLTDISGDVVSAKLSYIIRDHDKNTFESRLNRLRALEVEMNQKYGANTVALTITHSYENMLSVIEENMHVVELAKDAIFAVGLEPVSCPVRGGTDGARLSFMGLPCPNLGTGGYGFHGPYEHVSVNAMERVVKILKEIVSNPIDK